MSGKYGSTETHSGTLEHVNGEFGVPGGWCIQRYFVRFYLISRILRSALAILLLAGILLIIEQVNKSNGPDVTTTCLRISEAR